LGVLTGASTENSYYPGTSRRARCYCTGNGAEKQRDMSHSIYLRQQAELLLNLARATIDLGIARRLRALAAEFRAKADELDAGPSLPFPLPIASTREMGRG
jgi:hypothetical protein